MTKSKSTAQLLEQAIENLLVSATPGLSIEAQTRLVIEQEADLIEALTDDWRFRAVLAMVRQKRTELNRRDRSADQYLLPGFDHLPQRIVISEGRRRPLAKATYRQLREYLAVLHQRHRDSERVGEVKALIEVVRKYATDQPGITVKEACQRASRK